MRLYLRSTDRKPDPPPLVTNDRAAIIVGMGVWAVLWVLALLLHGRLTATGHDWWVWTPPVGILLGLLGLATLYRRDRRR